VPRLLTVAASAPSDGVAHSRTEVLSRWPQTPCALRLRKPNHPTWTSDVPRRTPVQRAGSLIPRPRPIARLTSGFGPFPGAPELGFTRTCLGCERSSLRTPSIGSISRLATRAGKFAHQRFVGSRLHLAPVRVPRCSSPRHGLSYRFTLPRLVLGSPLGRLRSRTGKMLLTDFCNCIHDTSTCSNVRLSR